MFTLSDVILRCRPRTSRLTHHCAARSTAAGQWGYTIPGLLYNVVELIEVGQQASTLASKYGEWYQYFNGVDITLNLRTQGGLTLQGGTSTGQNVADNCDVRENLPELSVGIGAGLVGSNVSMTSPYCHVAYGWLTQLRGLGSYVIPKIDTQVSAVFQSKPGRYSLPTTRCRRPASRSSSGDLPRERS